MTLGAGSNVAVVLESSASATLARTVVANGKTTITYVNRGAGRTAYLKVTPALHTRSDDYTLTLATR